MIQKILVAIIAFSGLFAGKILARIAPEEIKPGMIYFKLFRILTSFGILATAMYIASVGFKTINFFAAFLLITTGAIATLYIKLLQVRYLYLGIILFSAHNAPSLFVLLASLIFLDGLPTGTLLWKSKSFNKIANILGFFVPSVFLFTDVGNHLIYFAIGALLALQNDLVLNRPGTL